MTQTIYGWIIIKKDGTPYHHAQTRSVAIFDQRPDALKVAQTLEGSRVVPCTSQYEV
jgi:hypothetical protein